MRQFHSSMGNVGQSLSAQPLLPIGDTSLGKLSTFVAQGQDTNGYLTKV